jgi:hypothetical protein
MTLECHACRAGLDHCHGTAIVHPDRETECTEPDCLGLDVAHAFTLDCDAVGCRCATTATAVAG